MTLQHETNYKGHILEIEMYTSYESVTLMYGLDNNEGALRKSPLKLFKVSLFVT